MSDFVNYNKRGPNLPEGCKDLIDVLKPGLNKADLVRAMLAQNLPFQGGDLLDVLIATCRQRGMSEEAAREKALELFSKASPMVKGDFWASTARREGGSASGTLSHMPAFMDRTYNATGYQANLHARCEGSPIEFTARKWYYEPFEVEVQFQEGTEAEETVIKSLRACKLTIPPKTPLPASFRPDLPVYLTYKLEPLPKTLPEISTLITDFLRQIGWHDEAPIQYDYDAILDLPPGIQ